MSVVEALVAPVLACLVVVVVLAARDIWREWRRSRARELVRRLRIASRCADCGAIGRVEFRRDVAACLGRLGESDEARAAAAIVAYGRRNATAAGHPWKVDR